MNRRNLLKGILAVGVAPYVCTTAGVLMPPRNVIVSRGIWYGKQGIDVNHPTFYRDSITYTTDGIHPNLDAPMFAHLWDVALSQKEMAALHKMKLGEVTSGKPIEIVRDNKIISSRILLF